MADEVYSVRVVRPWPGGPRRGETFVPPAIRRARLLADGFVEPAQEQKPKPQARTKRRRRNKRQNGKDLFE